MRNSHRRQFVFCYIALILQLIIKRDVKCHLWEPRRGYFGHLYSGSLVTNDLCLLLFQMVKSVPLLAMQAIRRRDITPIHS
jgi:hypothetical protein